MGCIIFRLKSYDKQPLLYIHHFESECEIHFNETYLHFYRNWGVRGVHALNRKDTQVNLTSLWCTLVTSTLYWANEAKA